eukprot:4568088-Prymnesium_polylepis.1
MGAQGSGRIQGVYRQGRGGRRRRVDRAGGLGPHPTRGAPIDPPKDVKRLLGLPRRRMNGAKVGVGWGWGWGGVGVWWECGGSVVGVWWEC